MRLNQHVTIVTGGASGFGEEICRYYATQGARVVVADINVILGEKTAADLTAAGHAAMFQYTDVTRTGDMAALVTTTLAHFGRPEIMVNKAGISHANQPILNVSKAEFDRIYAVTVKSLYLSAIHCVPIFRRQKSGCFINIGSTAAVHPRPGLTWYNGPKGAVVLTTKSMAVERAPDGVRANAINPAIADTPPLTTFMGAQDTVAGHRGQPRALHRFDPAKPTRPSERRGSRRRLPHGARLRIHHGRLPRGRTRALHLTPFPLICPPPQSP
jgi:3-oxoacyl-[acyl-carrier protein] reductase